MRQPLSYRRPRREFMLEQVPASVSAHLRHTLEALLCWVDDVDSVAWVDGGTLARQMGVSAQTVKDRLRGLREAGLLGETVRRWTPGYGWSYGYPVLRPASWLETILGAPALPVSEA